MTNLVDATAVEFAARFGYEPTGVWSAPGRVNLIGEHTDYNEGYALPLAISRKTFAAVALRTDGVVRVGSGFSDEVVTVKFDEIADTKLDWAAYPLGMAWAISKQTALASGFDIFIDSDVPVGAGLSSSAAIECAVGVALNELWNAGLSKEQLAACGQIGENQIVGAPTGIMDQTASMLGVRDHALLIDCRNLEVQPIALGFAAANLKLVVVDTRIEHRLVDGGYAARRASCELGAKLLQVDSLRDLAIEELEANRTRLDDVTYRRVHHVLTENERVLDFVDALGQKDFERIGELMRKSHDSLRDDYEVSVVELDQVVATSYEQGFIGARMTGGGFGGSAIALIDSDQILDFEQAIYRDFEAKQLLRPNIHVVEAGDGARRER